MTAEAIAFPRAGEHKGDLDAHFESEIEATSQEVEDTFREVGFLGRMRMSDAELIEYLNKYREQIALASQPSVENSNVIPLQASVKEDHKAAV